MLSFSISLGFLIVKNWIMYLLSVIDEMISCSYIYPRVQYITGPVEIVGSSPMPMTRNAERGSFVLPLFSFLIINDL